MKQIQLLFSYLDSLKMRVNTVAVAKAHSAAHWSLKGPRRIGDLRTRNNELFKRNKSLVAGIQHHYIQCSTKDTEQERLRQG